MSNYDLNRHKKSDKVKWVFTVIAFFLSFVLIVGLFLQVFGQGKVKPSEWFNTEQTETETENDDFSSGGAIVGNIQSNGISLMSEAVAMSDSVDDGVATVAAESTYTITATVTPAEATNKAVTGALSFANPSSSWASGKSVSDYATVTQGTSGVFTLSVLKEFGEPIILTVTSQDNPEVSATCTVDYIKRVSSVKIGTVSGGSSADIYFDRDNTVYFTPVYTDGTVQGDLKLSSISLNVNSTFSNYVKSNISGNSTSYSFNTSVSTPFNNYDGSASSHTFKLTSAAYTFCSAFGNTAGIYPYFTNAFIKAINNYQGAYDHGSISCSYTYKYGDTTISSGTASTSSLWFHSDGLSVSATSMSLDVSHIYA